MRKQAKRCKAKPKQVSLVNCSFQGSGKGVTLVETFDTAVESTIYRKTSEAVQGAAAAGFFRKRQNPTI